MGTGDVSNWRNEGGSVTSCCMWWYSDGDDALGEVHEIDV